MSWYGKMDEVLINLDRIEIIYIEQRGSGYVLLGRMESGREEVLSEGNYQDCRWAMRTIGWKPT